MTGPAEPGAGEPTEASPVESPVDGLGFDEAMAELQRVVAELEAGGQPLEASLALYERGVALQAHLDTLLGAAELRIRRLVERSGGRLEAVESHEDRADT